MRLLRSRRSVASNLSISVLERCSAARIFLTSLELRLPNGDDDELDEDDALFFSIRDQRPGTEAIEKENKE